jgi:hypothetical protein
VAKTGDIAVVAAALRSNRGLEPGIIAKAGHQLSSVVERRAAMNEGGVHGSDPNSRSLSRLRTIAVNGLLTMFAGVAKAPT